MTEFIWNERVEGLEESLHCEFKEVKEKPVQEIGKEVDHYVVAFLNVAGGSIYWGIVDDDYRVSGVRLSHQLRDEIKQVIAQKTATIAPPVPGEDIHLAFHPVINPDTRMPLADYFVVQVSVHKPTRNAFYLTGSGEAYIRTLAGLKKLGGFELLFNLLHQLEKKRAEIPDDMPEFTWMPSVGHRLRYIQPLLRGAHVLWVDDNPSYTLYERRILSALGISVDITQTTEEALFMLSKVHYDLILSDISREGDASAGLRLLPQIRSQGVSTLVIFYVANLERSRGTPAGAFGITNRPDELLHYIFDALERRMPG